MKNCAKITNLLLVSRGLKKKKKKDFSASIFPAAPIISAIIT